MSICSAIHVTLLLTTIVIYLSTFLLSYHICGILQNKSLMRFSIIVLFNGFMYYFYIISAKGMPGFFYNLNDPANSLIFYNLSSILGAVFFMFNSIKDEDQRITRKSRLLYLLSSIVFIALIYTIVNLNENIISFFRESALENIVQIISILILLIPEYIYFSKYKNTKNKSYISLLISFVVLQFNIVFLNTEILNYSLLSDVLGVLSGIFLFLFIFDFYIKNPYNTLMKNQVELQQYAQSLDNIVDNRTNQIRDMNKKMLEDLEYAKDIQKAMIPRELPQKPEYAISARYIAADKVSGDFYNVIQIDDENIVMYIGDVAGHGVSAAMLTVFVNQNIQPIAETEYGDTEIVTPSNVLKKLYTTFNKTNFKEEVYFVILYAIYNIKNHKLIYSSAGMNVQPLVMKKGGKFETLDIKGFPICKFIDYYVADYKDKIIVLEKGEKVVFYTDGLIDALVEENDEFSENLVKAKLMDGTGKSADEVSEYLNELLLNSSKLENPKDDITWLILEAKQ